MIFLKDTVPSWFSIQKSRASLSTSDQKPYFIKLTETIEKNIKKKVFDGGGGLNKVECYDWPKKKK